MNADQERRRAPAPKTTASKTGVLGGSNTPRLLWRGRFFPYFLLLSAVFFALHLPYLRLPYFWDELGQFIPASLDLFHTGAWIPYTTVPNSHPPGLMAYLALVWKIFGYSIPATRVAMLLIAVSGAAITWLLARELDAPPLLATTLLIASPLFFAQAMLAQLDLPTLPLTCLALLLFLRNRIVFCAIVCIVLVMVKETSIAVPFVLGFWALFRPVDGQRRREAFWFTCCLVPLAIWFWALKGATGHLFGNDAFTHYNLWYSLRPVRLVLATMRRLYYLFVGSGHLIGTLTLIWIIRREAAKTALEAADKSFHSRAWRIVVTVAIVQVALVTALGGAELERYLLPVLPLVYIAFSRALARLALAPEVSGGGPRLALTATVVLLICLIAANRIYPPYPFPMENNLAVVDFVELHQRAAAFLELHFDPSDEKPSNTPDALIATTFPLASALRRPEFGYVARPLQVMEISGFTRAQIEPLRSKHPSTVVITSSWDPWRLFTKPGMTQIVGKFYDYQPPLEPAEIAKILGMSRVAGWKQGGFEVTILTASLAVDAKVDAKMNTTIDTLIARSPAHSY